MAKIRETYICSACGAQTSQWRGQCPSCQEWNTLEQRTVSAAPAAKRRAPALSAAGGGRNRPVVLATVSEEACRPFGTGMAALDRVLG